MMKHIVSLVVILSMILAATAQSSNRSGGRARSKNNSMEKIAPEFVQSDTLNVTAKTFAPKRTKPVFTGAFLVDLVIITFPDRTLPEPETVCTDLASLGEHSIEAYYKEYSQGITWPVLRAFTTVYTAPEVFGYYCRSDPHYNPIGWDNTGDGSARVEKLRANALAAVSRSRYITGSPTGKAAVTCFVYCTQPDLERGESELRKHFKKPTPEQESDGAEDSLKKYSPNIAWADPLWPNSLPQITYPANGGTLVHELGHVLGAPDFYHASEERDGRPGVPALPWSFGPTGPAYCRAIYQAFIPPTAYPTYTQPGTYTLAPRATNPVGNATVGCFIPSSHPNYLFYLEYVDNESRPVGTPDAHGLLIHVINVTMGSPMMGPPDMCYTYRPDDPYFRAVACDASNGYFTDGMSFDATSNPAARLPNQQPAGIAISDITCTSTGATFTLSFPPTTFTPKQLNDNLLPKIALTDVDELLPTSFRATADIIYRGEPLLTEYGFCYDVAPRPTILKKTFPLYHYDRYDGRILGLDPGRTYYVRAYVKNAKGVTYSEEEKKVTLPGLTPRPETVPPLLTDRLRGNFYITRWHFLNRGGIRDCAADILAFMSLAAYYRTIPGDAARGKNKNALNPARIHTHPYVGRHPPRLAEVEALRHTMGSLVNTLGLNKQKFGNARQWDSAFKKVLGLRGKDDVLTVSADTISLHADKIKDWLTRAQPVMVIRQNTLMPGETSAFFPLNIAIIDGYSADGSTYHITYPNGDDRGTQRRDGDYTLDVLFENTEEARLVFYTPLPATRR